MRLVWLHAARWTLTFVFFFSTFWIVVVIFNDYSVVIYTPQLVLWVFSLGFLFLWWWIVISFMGSSLFALAHWVLFHRWNECILIEQEYDVEDSLLPVQPSLNYTAPELVRSKTSSIGCSSDIFSFGCLAYHLIAHKPLFDCNNNVKMVWFYHKLFNFILFIIHILALGPSLENDVNHHSIQKSQFHRCCNVWCSTLSIKFVGLCQKFDLECSVWLFLSFLFGVS